MKKQSISNYIRIYRNRSGLTLDELAFLMGHRSASQLSRHERGECEPPLGLALALEIAFRCRLDELFPHQHEIAQLRIRKRAARLVEKLGRREYEGRTQQKVEFLAAIVQTPDTHHR